MLDGPTFPALHSRAQNEMTVFALEAVDVIVPPQSSDPGGLALTFLGEDGLFAGPTAQRELSVRLSGVSQLFYKLLDEENYLSRVITISLASPVIVLGAVGLVLLVQSHHLTVQLLPTDRALEAVVVEPHLPHHQGSVALRRDLLPAGRAGPGADQLHVVLLAHHHALHHADPVQDEIITDTADMANTPEIFLADGKIFEGEILVHHLLPAHLTLNTNQH